MAEQTPPNAVKIEMDSLPNGTSDPVVPNSSAVNRDIDFEFLPLFYEVIKSIEREPTADASGKGREGQDTSAKVLELEKKLSEARQQILLLPGIEHSKEEQLRQLELCRKQVLLKQKLITKYRNLCTFSLTE